MHVTTKSNSARKVTRKCKWIDIYGNGKRNLIHRKDIDRGKRDRNGDEVGENQIKSNVGRGSRSSIKDVYVKGDLGSGANDSSGGRGGGLGLIIS